MLIGSVLKAAALRLVSAAPTVHELGVRPISRVGKPGLPDQRTPDLTKRIDNRRQLELRCQRLGGLLLQQIGLTRTLSQELVGVNRRRKACAGELL